MTEINLILDTLPLTEKKTGIGYCVQNLFVRLKKCEDITVFPVHNMRSGYSNLHRVLKAVSNPFKKVAGNHYPKGLAALLYDVVVSPTLVASKFRLRKVIYKVDIYHETRHIILREIEPYMGKLKLVSDIHDLSPLVYPNWHLKSHVEEVERNFATLIASDCIITKSQFIKNQLIREFGVSEKNISVIPNACGANYHRLGSKQKRKARIGLADIIGEDRFLLYTGTIEPRKNLKTLFDALKILRERHNVKLIVAGGYGWKYEAIVDYPKKIGINDVVKFLGYTSESVLQNLYNLCEAFIYPSWYEGFGMPPLEAMSCGTVPIVSNSSSLPEVVGDCGLLFDPHSPQELADKIDYVLRNPELRTSLETKGVERAKRFNWDHITEETIKVYRRIAANE